MTIQIEQVMFDDPQKLGCSTGLCSTIQIEQVMFDDPQKLGCSTRIMFDVDVDVEQQLSNKTLIEHNLFLGYV